MAGSERPRVTIIGGGLGGLATALALAESQKVDVTILERSERLGGAAGASLVDGRYEDHGYHIFPPWYRNVYAILERLNLRERLEDMTQFHQLRAGEYPAAKPLTNFTSLRFAWRNLRSGAIPFWDLVLYYYSVIDLICQPYRLRAFLDQISLSGFVRSRFYRTEAIAKQYHDLLLKFVSVPSYRVSAMTVQKMLSFWVADGVPCTGFFQEICTRHSLASGNSGFWSWAARWSRMRKSRSCGSRAGESAAWMYCRLVVARRLHGPLRT